MLLYHYFGKALPTKEEDIHLKRAGDIMLFGANCLVIFTRDVESPYLYTRLGRVDDLAELSKAIGENNLLATIKES